MDPEKLMGSREGRLTLVDVLPPVTMRSST